MPLRPDRLKQIREARGFTQEELSSLCGVSKMQMFRYEKGMNDASSTMLEAIARQLNVSTDYLLGLTDTPLTHLGDELRPDQRKLLEAFEIGDSRTMIEIIADRLRSLAKDD